MNGMALLRLHPCDIVRACLIASASLCGCGAPEQSVMARLPVSPADPGVERAGASAGPNGAAGQSVASSTLGAGGSGGSSAPTKPPGVAAAAGTAAAAGGGGTGGSHMHTRDHCAEGYEPQASDETMKDGAADFYPPGNMDPSIVDTTVQPEVLSWMRDNLWEAAHVEWHAIRGCGVPGGGGLSKVNICSFTPTIPKDQNCQTAGDGYQFLVFHRHMIQALKQLWPKHTEQFTGFAKFPTSAADVPAQWRSAWKDWDADALAAGKIGDEIDKPENLARFPDEGVLGFWLQCNVGQKLANPPNNMPFVGLHFLLHAKWARPGNTAHGVNNTSANIDNYMFWKLHGWIDNVWEKYRRARGMQPTDPKLTDDLIAQCREMDSEIQIIKNTNLPPSSVNSSDPLPAESGFFHEKVRPIFASKTNLCSGCHAETGANALLTLGGNLSSRQIVDGLVNRPSNDGGQFKIVVPGDPDHSWLYLKASGKASAAGCTASSTAQCITATMPPSASGAPTLSATELQTLRQWILDGALGPP
jgi:hypothetical protein